MSGWWVLGGVVVGEVLLLTPAQAAEVLQVRESWLRRRAAERRVPCCFVGSICGSPVRIWRRSWLRALIRPELRARSTVASVWLATGNLVHPIGGRDHIRACSLGCMERPCCRAPIVRSGQS